MEISKNNIPLSFEDAEGEIDYTITNDYMFRAHKVFNDKFTLNMLSLKRKRLIKRRPI